MSVGTDRVARLAACQHRGFIGLCRSEETIAVAIADGGQRGEARFFGSIGNRPEAVRKLVEGLPRFMLRPVIPLACRTFS